MKTVAEILSKLPKKDYWDVATVSKAFGVCQQAIQRASLKYSIGRLLPTKGRGKRIFVQKDIEKLCTIIQGYPGNKKGFNQWTKTESTL